MWLDLTLILAGLALLYYGGDLLITGSVRVARHYRLPPFVIGATIMGFGTSAPELCVSILAAIKGAPEVALGNVVGSNVANIGLVLGITTFLVPVAIQPERFKRETPPLLLATALLLLFNWNQFLGRVEGLVLVACLVAYILRSLGSRDEGDAELEEDHRFFPNAGLSVQFLLIAVGLAGLVLGAHWMVNGSVNIARSFGVSEWLIGITIVAVGTSLPEIVSSAMSALRGHGEMALGNVFGSNIFNVTMVLGTASLMHPLEIATPIKMDLLFCGGLTLLLLILIRLEHVLVKRDGIILLFCYGGYIGMKSAGWF